MRLANEENWKEVVKAGSIILMCPSAVSATMSVAATERDALTAGVAVDTDKAGPDAFKTETLMAWAAVHKTRSNEEGSYPLNAEQSAAASQQQSRVLFSHNISTHCYLRLLQDSLYKRSACAPEQLNLPIDELATVAGPPKAHDHNKPKYGHVSGIWLPKKRIHKFVGEPDLKLMYLFPLDNISGCKGAIGSFILWFQIDRDLSMSVLEIWS